MNAAAWLNKNINNYLIAIRAQLKERMIQILNSNNYLRNCYYLRGEM